MNTKIQTPSARMMVMVGRQFACIRLIGRANFTSSIDFRTLINELRHKGTPILFWTCPSAC